MGELTRITQVTAWDSARVSAPDDLKIIDGRLFATTNYDGRIYSWTLSDDDLTLRNAQAHSDVLRPGGHGWITPLDLDAGPVIMTGGGAGGALVLRGVSGNGALLPGDTVAGSTGLWGSLQHTASIAASNGNHVVWGGLAGTSGVAQMTFSDQGRLIDKRIIADTPSIYAADVSSAVTATVSGQTYLFTASALENGVTTWAVGATGTLTARHATGNAESLWISAPTAVGQISAGGSDWLVVAAAGTDSLTTLRIGADGSLTPVDHLLDTRDTRFGEVAAMTTIRHQGQAYVIAGGGDDGITLLQLLPDGTLLHRATLADAVDTTLANVSAITARSNGSAIDIYVGSASEPGLTLLRYDAGAAGLTRTAGPAGGSLSGSAGGDLLTGGAGADRLFGGAGDDILRDGAGTDTLTGGAGADIFVLAADGTPDTIADFQPGLDRIDLSGWSFLRSRSQLDLAITQTGFRITYGDEVLEVRSAGGQPVDHRTLPEADLIGAFRIPIVITPGYTTPPLDPVDLPVYEGYTSGLQPRPPGAVPSVWDVPGSDPADQPDPGAWPLIAGSGAIPRISFGGISNYAISGIRWSGGGAGDRKSGTARSDKLDGNRGHDTIWGQAGHDYIYGDSGNDRLYGSANNDRIYGGSWNDALFGGSGRDRIYGGTGNDAMFSGSNDDVVYAGDGNDRAYGWSGNDRMFGDSGADRLYGEAGNDWLSGGSGRDRLYGGSGGDWLYGGSSGDALFGGSGNDRLSAGSGDDYLDGGSGNDLMFGTAGKDILYGRDGNDTLYGGSDGDRLYSGAGNDRILGGSGNDRIASGSGDDRISGDSGHDLIYGESGRDLIYGSSGDDTVFGGSGDDALYGGSGNDAVQGGDGDDRIDAGAGDDRVFGGAGNDTVHGNAGADSLSGDAGTDTLFGGDGDDRLSGGDGADDLSGGTGQDILWGDAGDDMLRGAKDEDTLYGGTGQDTLSGDAGDDILFGDAGTDTLDGGSGNDTLFGGDDADILLGGDGDDSLLGETGADSLFGGAGDDTLLGGDGDDWLDAGAGLGILTGGAGADSFVFTQGAATVTDFDPLMDRIMIETDLWGGGISRDDLMFLYGRMDGADAILSFGDDTALTVAGTTLDTLADTLVFI
ncbi:calcium-binding protein [Loktanella sp. 3ANDIMAR09]|uniref:calcium-binding protein n=1 Tax=Loktanella sp. 3ANDIMAR09 TaxID=1225657 RepID=UPI0006FE498A|nr:calcium-binding protein [Loktanella sp. 3ANDIMAR09]